MKELMGVGIRCAEMTVRVVTKIYRMRIDTK